MKVPSLHQQKKVFLITLSERGGSFSSNQKRPIHIPTYEHRGWDKRYAISSKGSRENVLQNVPSTKYKKQM